MTKDRKSGEKTLLMSIILSSFGPLAMGIGLFVGKSSTQLADFLRRTAELLAIIVSYLIYKKINKKESKEEVENKERLERLANIFVGLAMIISGSGMIIIAFLGANSEKGNVIPGLTIAFLGLVTNSWFWIRYSKLAKLNQDSILEVQSKLYRAKSIVDTCVFTVLLIVMIGPISRAAYWADILGSIMVSLYLIINGLGILRDNKKMNT